MNLTAEQMIDPTSAHRIFAELEYAGSEITAVVEVFDLPLAEVGEYFLNDNSEAVTLLAVAGKIKIIFHSYQTDIPMTNCVDCIRVEPYYLIKDRKCKYE